MARQAKHYPERNYIDIWEDWERDPRKAGKIIVSLTERILQNMAVHDDELKSLKTMYDDVEESIEYNKTFGKIHAYRTVYDYILELTELDRKGLLEILKIYESEETN